MRRIGAIDMMRGIALVAMTLYHFVWDLEFNGWVLPGTTLEPGWIFFARSIAFSFLFLVGVSLVLAHGQTIRWASFWKRFAMVAGAAALISLVTWFAVPNAFIFFGILHAIALFSLLGLLFVRLPWFWPVLAAVTLYGIKTSFSADIFSHPTLLWVGLATIPPVANDYVPLFPWFGATLLGIATARIITHRDKWKSIAKLILPNVADKPLQFIGRHSLIYYLLHQPILLGLLWAFAAVAGPPDRTQSFLQLCSQQCSQSRDETFCATYCGCVADKMKQEELFTPFHEGRVDITTNATAQTIIRQCTASSE